MPATLPGAPSKGREYGWEYGVTSGPYTLRARATDSSGATQAATVPFNDGDYVFSPIVQHPVVAA